MLLLLDIKHAATVAIRNERAELNTGSCRLDFTYKTSVLLQVVCRLV